MSAGNTTVSVSAVTDFAALAAKWRDLETRSEPSFFQSWTWTGCLIEERFPDPILVEARENSGTVALALFNRRGRALHLGHSGDPALDCPYIEFNGVLAETGREAALTAACLKACRGGRFSRSRLILDAVDDATRAAAAHVGEIHHIRSMAAPLADLTPEGSDFLDRRSANTRHQLRRSNRAYAAIGDVVTRRAETISEAYEFLRTLTSLHQASWLARGRPGAFASPFFGRFHRELVARGMERGEIDLLRVAAGNQVIGFLYNFRYRGRSLAYQSGFDYAGAGRHGKPGLTCHHEAIRFATSWGATRYDFLAGDDRYKRSLSDRAETLHWIVVTDPYSLRLLGRRALDLSGRLLPKFVRPRARPVARSPNLAVHGPLFERSETHILA